jgi:hypothetical protein
MALMRTVNICPGNFWKVEVDRGTRMRMFSGESHGEKCEIKDLRKKR